MSTTRNRRKRYGLIHFLWDFFLICITGGLWGVYLILRFMYTGGR